ncbi:squalene/phytoene synthase family protein [Hyphococcus sp.]|uniref:squalene/phytoene synthase family protein n=1 Tax=Hyphococcus sp. TaxID=2038636 RepID=UPI00375169E5
MSDSLAQSSTQSMAYCSDLLRRQDEDRWLAARYAPEPLRCAMIALGAFGLELHRIPGAVSEPALGEIRLQWWREAFEEIRNGKPPRAHPVVEAVAATGLHHADYAPQIDGMIDAMTRPLYGEKHTSADNLTECLVKSDGAADGIAAALAGGDSALVEAAIKAGAAFAMAREGAAIAPNLAADLPAQSLRLYQEAAPSLANARSELVPAFLHLSLTPIYAKNAGKSFPIRKRLRLFLAMAVAKF